MIETTTGLSCDKSPVPAGVKDRRHMRGYALRRWGYGIEGELPYADGGCDNVVSVRLEDVYWVAA